MHDCGMELQQNPSHNGAKKSHKEASPAMNLHTDEVDNEEYQKDRTQPPSPISKSKKNGDGECRG